MEENTKIKINYLEPRICDYSRYVEDTNEENKFKEESPLTEEERRMIDAMRISFTARKKVAEELRESQRRGNRELELPEKLLEETSMNDSIDSSDNHRLPNVATIICPKPCMHEYPEITCYIKKKSSYLFKRWKTKFCSLRNFKLLYYQSLEKERPTGIIDFIYEKYIYEEILNSDKTIKEIILATVNREKVFRFRSVGQLSKMNDLAQGIKYYINKAFENERPQKYLRIKKFWKNEIVSYSKFTEIIDTLDIILFRGKSIGAKIQHTFTRSEYDHVALMARFNNGKLALFEATGKEVIVFLIQGVGICLWDQFMFYKWYLLYEKMAFRKLDFYRTQDTIKKVDQFMKNTIGKNFKITLNKLLRKKTSANKKEEDDTYFCSELVAEAYRRIGLLPEDKVSSQYWPVNFSSVKSLNLLKGASLGPEILIDFNEEIAKYK